MTNMLDLVPAFQRQIGIYQDTTDTPSSLAGYLADGVEGLISRWNRDYAIDFTPPETYICNPDIEPQDKRPIILLASIIYKVSNINFASYRDGDFAYDPMKTTTGNPLDVDVAELKLYLPTGMRLARPSSAPLRGFSNIYNPESYTWITAIVNNVV